DTQWTKGERSTLFEDWFELFQGRQVRALPEQANRYFVTPLVGCFHRCMKVRGVVALFFEDLYARVEKLIRVVFVIGNAGAEDVDQREAPVLNRALQQIDEVLLFAAEAARHIRRASGDRH